MRASCTTSSRRSELEELKIKHPNAKVLVHPESPAGVIAMADAVGSTTGIIQAAERLGAKEYIVATDGGMMHQMRKLMPGVKFIEAPTAGKGATCQSCAHCPWMAMNGLAEPAHVLETGANEIHVDPALGQRARVPIDRMLAFTAALKSGQPAGCWAPTSAPPEPAPLGALQAREITCSWVRIVGNATGSICG